jgi:hypothetical protein
MRKLSEQFYGEVLMPELAESTNTQAGTNGESKRTRAPTSKVALVAIGLTVVGLQISGLTYAVRPWSAQASLVGAEVAMPVDQQIGIGVAQLARVPTTIAITYPVMSDARALATAPAPTSADSPTENSTTIDVDRAQSRPVPVQFLASDNAPGPNSSADPSNQAAPLAGVQLTPTLTELAQDEAIELPSRREHHIAESVIADSVDAKVITALVAASEKPQIKPDAVVVADAATRAPLVASISRPRPRARPESIAMSTPSVAKVAESTGTPTKLASAPPTPSVVSSSQQSEALVSGADVVAEKVALDKPAPTKKHRTAGAQPVWFEGHPGNHFTLQLVSMRAPAGVETLLGELSGFPQLAHVRIQRPDGTQHVLLQGIYAARDEAQRAAKMFSGRTGEKPWIRRLDDVLNALQKGA